ncbi:hypothetical protein Lal_00033658, partial [Lupinus albus]
CPPSLPRPGEPHLAQARILGNPRSIYWASHLAKALSLKRESPSIPQNFTSLRQIKLGRHRLNALTHEYELFRMFPHASVTDMQKHFTHIVNHLVALDNPGSLAWARKESPGREWLNWVSGILGYTEGFSLERELSRLSESHLA